MTALATMLRASTITPPDAIDLFGTLLDAASTIKLAGETVYACGTGHPAFSEQALRDARSAATKVLVEISKYEAMR
ncbi:MAG: hypothetical protein KGL39_59780 [Patescibacteria group bacterium]|nr:hypothetical protein [Patescibacteria group bacterium]